MQCWRLDDTRQTLVLAAKSDRLPQIVYWGAPLPDTENLETLAKAHAIDVTGGMLDANPDVSLCPEASQTFPGHPGLILFDADGAPIHPELLLTSARADETAVHFTSTDHSLGLTYQATITLDAQTHVLTSSASLTSETPVQLNWLAAPVFPALQSSNEMIDFAGRWCGEFLSQRTPWSSGIRLRENRTGRTGHEHFPGLIVPAQGTTNTSGTAQAFHYGWSGGHRMIAEELPDGRRQIQFGNTPGLEHQTGTHFETAPLYATFSTSGLNGCATAFQRHLRERVVTFPDAARPRPVHYNCWEAVYFDHSLDELKNIASRAASLGAERFVLDDGWFGQRDDDTSSLGDWTIDPRKYPEGLTELIEHVHAENMTFGLWFEPEMINQDSDLFRAHPDWILGQPDQTLGRQQMVLDMSRPQVRDHLFSKISAILGSYPIDYIKWDHNRVLPTPGSNQTLGTYALMDALLDAHPGVEIESCASGGGRIDFGILSRTHRVWLSDSNDALERIRIQHEAALFLPMVVTGSHVGPRHCHTSGRTLDISLRAWTAAQRHMGFEMDPRELSEHEADVLRHVTQWWKDNRHWTQNADILRLDSDEPAVTAEMQQACDGSRFVLFAAKTDTSSQISPRPLRLTGLDPASSYTITLKTRADIPALSRGTPLLKEGSATLSGAYLMQHGITLPWTFPDTMHVLEGQKA